MSGGQPAPGPRGRFFSLTSDDERQRLVDAATKAVAERGYEELTVEHVLAYAGLPEAVFHEHFAGKDQCLMAAYDAFAERLLADVSAACHEQSDWAGRVRAGVDAAISFLAESLTLARVFAVEVAAAGPVAVQRRLALIDRLAALLREGRGLYPESASLPPATERALVAGAVVIVSGHLLAEEPLDSVPGLRPELVELLLAPYLGASAAKRLAVA